MPSCAAGENLSSSRHEGGREVGRSPLPPMLERERRENAAADAEQRLSSSTALLEAFDAGLDPVEEDRAFCFWPSSDKAIDQYPRSDASPDDPFESSQVSKYAKTEPPLVIGESRQLKRSHDNAYPPGSGGIEPLSSVTVKKSRKIG